MADAARHGRSGLDSRDLLDNAVRSSAERILPQFQQNPGGRLSADVEQGEGDGRVQGQDVRANQGLLWEGRSTLAWTLTW